MPIERSRFEPTGPAPGAGETLFNVLEEGRKQEAAKDLLSFKADLEAKHQEKANQLAEHIEDLRHQYHIQEAEETFNRAAAHQTLLGSELAAHTQQQIQSLIEAGGGAAIPGFTTTTMPSPERAETEGATVSPIKVPPGAAAAMQKDVGGMLSERYKESLARQREELLQASPEQLTSAKTLSDKLRETKDPQHGIIADYLDSVSTPGVHKADLAGAMKTGALNLAMHEEKMTQLKATLDGTAARAREIEKMKSDSAMAINQLRYGEGSIAQANLAIHKLQLLQAQHKGFDDDIKALITQRAQIFSKAGQAQIDAQIQKYTTQRDAVQDMISQGWETISQSKMRGAASPEDMQIRQLMERALQNAGIDKRIPWNTGGTDQQAFESALTPAEQKKAREEYMKLRGK